MKGYSCDFSEQDFASARIEDVNASYKDLTEVCGVIRNKKADWAVDFLTKAAAGEVPVFFRRHNKRLGHRKELGGKKGRYPKKSAAIVLKVVKSAMANGTVKGLGEGFVIVHATANKKRTYPRMAPKGRQARSFLVTSRVEIVLKPTDAAPKGVEVRAPKKPDAKPVEKKAEAKVPKKEEKPAPKKEAPKPEEKKAEEKEDPPHDALKKEGLKEQQHKHSEENAVHHEHPKMEHDHGQARKTEIKKE
ncbi:MAG: 50S ribosomal protein L22 [Candidatus Micrarchaeota archaeon]